jgi:hypothetical protein
VGGRDVGGFEVARFDLELGAPAALRDGAVADLVLACAARAAAVLCCAVAVFDLIARPLRKAAAGDAASARTVFRSGVLEFLPARDAFVGAGPCAGPGLAAPRLPPAVFAPAAVSLAAVSLAAVSLAVWARCFPPPGFAPTSKPPVSGFSAPFRRTAAGARWPARAGGAPRACLGETCLGMKARDSFGCDTLTTCTRRRAPACSHAANPLHPPLSRQGGPFGRMP